MHFNVIPVVRAGKIEYQDIIPLYLFETGKPVDRSLFVL